MLCLLFQSDDCRPTVTDTQQENRKLHALCSAMNLALSCPNGKESVELLVQSSRIQGDLEEALAENIPLNVSYFCFKFFASSSSPPPAPSPHGDSLTHLCCRSLCASIASLTLSWNFAHSLSTRSSPPSLSTTSIAIFRILSTRRIVRFGIWTRRRK